LTLFSAVKTDLKLYPEVESLLQNLKTRKFKLGLLTNGNVETQRNKVSLLKLEKYFDAIIYARDLGVSCEKPNPLAFKAVLAALGSKPEETVYVGDNPHTDFIGAKKLGIKTIRLLDGEFKAVHIGLAYEADIDAQNIDEVNILLMKSQ
jgi:putative hydrolase of the HAD superfamily